MNKDKCSESFKHKYLIEQLNDEFLAEQFMYYLYIVYSPIVGTMKNEIKFGILFAAIVAVAAGTFATVLDDAFAEPPKKNPGQFPPGQTQGGGQSPGNSPPGNSGGGQPPGQRGN